MPTTPDPVLELLRAATTSPSWVQRGYTTEKNHTHVLVSALNSGKQAEARSLAAALWNLASEDKLEADQITAVTATPEYKLKQGEHSTIDLLIVLKVKGEFRQLAVEVKVDGKPYSAQLASMSAALPLDPPSRLVLLSLGAAQASRIEPDESTTPDVRRWSVADMLGLGGLIIAASPVPDDTKAWLAELQREEHRREKAWADDSALAGCGYRGRLMEAYRYKQVAERLEVLGACWEVSLQTHGVVLHGKSSHQEIPGTTTTLYLEIAGGTLRVKAGAWYDDSDARAAAQPLVPLITEALVAGGFTVSLAKRRSGASVTLMSVDLDGEGWTLDSVVNRLQRVHAAWRSIIWPK